MQLAAFRRLLLPLMAAGAAGTALGKVAKGPFIAVESDAGAPIEVLKPEPPKGTKPEVEVKRIRYEMNLLVPLPFKILGGMFVLKGDLFKEHREYDPIAKGPSENDARNPNVAGTGAVFLPHASEGAPRYLVVAERYGEMSFKDDAKPMAEFIFGADIADDALPFSLKIGDTDETDSRALIRLRRFPGFDRWLVLVGHRIDRKNGFSLDIAIPSHVLVGYEIQDGAWKVYAGGKGTSREYPVYGIRGAGWVDGNAIYLFSGLRRRIVGPAYVALEAGITREHLEFHDEKGKTVAIQETQFKPFARLALETWVVTPGPGTPEGK